MTVAGSVAGRRYSLQHADGRAGAAERWVGYDERLGRAVVVWVLERDEAHADREYLLSVARSIARAPQRVFLRILDIVPEPQQLSIILELPEPPDDGAAVPRLPALAAARMVLELAEALDAAEAGGIVLARLSNEYLHRGDDGGVRADPIGLFLPGTQQVTPSATPLVDLLGAVIEPRAPISARAFEPADAEVRQLVVRWERHDGDLTQLIEELRDIVGVSARAPAPVAAPARSVPEPSEVTAEFTPWAPSVAPDTDPRPTRTSRGREVRWGVAIPAAAAVLAVVLGLAGLMIASQIGMSPAGLSPGGSDDSSAPPVSQPGANEVTVGLLAQEPSNVRVTVDGVVEFDGVLNAGERQLWEGTDGIRVWTDSGQTLLLSVNGHDLGPYSPAMGRRQNDAEIAAWNRIDFGFGPDWAP